MKYLLVAKPIHIWTICKAFHLKVEYFMSHNIEIWFTSTRRYCLKRYLILQLVP